MTIVELLTALYRKFSEEQLHEFVDHQNPGLRAVNTYLAGCGDIAEKIPIRKLLKADMATNGW